MRSPTIARPISRFFDVDVVLLDVASHPDTVSLGPTRVERLGDLPRAGGSELRDAPEAGAGLLRIGEVLRARAHA